jgi:hypothetical protein
MHSDIKRGMAMLGAVTQLENHPKIPPNARAAVLFAEVREAFLAIQAMGGAQDSSRNRFLSGTSERRHVANAMRLLMRQIARVAKVLKRSEYPGAREKLQVPRSNGYSALLTRASLYLETLPSIKSAFIERGMPADFDLRLAVADRRFEAGHHAQADRPRRSRSAAPQECAPRLRRSGPGRAGIGRDHEPAPGQ